MSISLIYDTLVLVAPFLKYGIKCEIVAKVFTFNLLLKGRRLKHEILLEFNQLLIIVIGKH